MRKECVMMAYDKWIRVVRRLMCGITILILLSMVVLIAAPGQSRAGAFEVECVKPRIWEGASINAVILPYAYTGGDRKYLSKTAEELTHLVQMNILFSILKYGRIGTTALSTRGISQEAIKQVCSAGTVMAKILGQQKGAKNEIQPGRGVVLLWGYIYEEGDNIYVQSYVRFLRRNVIDGIVLPLETGSKRELKGRFTTQALAFAPRRLTFQEVNEISKVFRESARLYNRPRTGSSSRELNPHDPLQFYIADVEDGWMYIRGYEGQAQGWVQAQVSLAAMPLVRKLPELSFIEAAVGYMRYQIHRQGSDPHPNPHRLVEWIHDRLSKFQAEIYDEGAPEPLAAARILSGNLDIISTSPENMVGAVTSAKRKYTEAVALMPYSAEARNLEAIAGIFLGQANGWESLNPADIAKALMDSLALDAGNFDILANLEKLFLLMDDLPAEKRRMQKGELDRNLAAVRRVQASLSK